MKSILCSLLIIAFSFSLRAQITIDQSDMPVAGDTLRFSVAQLDTNVLLNYQNTGANFNWQFGSLVPLRQGISEYVPSITTPYGFNFPNTIGEKIADTLSLGGISLTNVYNFYNSNTSEFKTEGRGVTYAGLPFPISIPFTDDDEIYQFPLNFNDRDSSTFLFTFSTLFPISVLYESSGYRINEVDGWGQITTPYGTFSCLRVVTDIVASDTVSFNNIAQRIPTHQREYKWLTDQMGIPVLQVSGNVIAGNFVPTNVQYRDSVRNVGSIFSPIALFDTDTTTVNVGDTVVFNNNSIVFGTAAYNWSFTPNTVTYVNGSGSLSVEPEVVFNQAGSYDVRLDVSTSLGNDDTTRMAYVQVIAPTGIREQKQNIDFQLYPNPLTDRQLQLTFGTKVDHTLLLEFQDMAGRTWARHEIPSNQVNGSQKALIELPQELPAGIYFIQLRSGDAYSSKKLIVR